MEEDVEDAAVVETPIFRWGGARFATANEDDSGHRKVVLWR